MRCLTLEFMREQGIGSISIMLRCSLNSIYRRMGFKAGDLLPEAEAYYNETISLALFASMRETQQSQVVAALAEAVGP